MSRNLRPMNATTGSGRAPAAGQGGPGTRVASGGPTIGRLTAQDLYALAFGLFLGLALVKFGNPVILDSKVSPPGSISELWSYAWPPRWSVWLLSPLAVAGVWLAVTSKARWPGTPWLWALPTLWFGWQLVSATHTVDGTLTAMTLRHFAGCLACYFAGALVLGRPRSVQWMLIGLLAGFTFCLVRAANQRLFEFPQERQALIESERAGWTNVAPGVLMEMKRDGTVITTNGVDVVNPTVLAKYSGGRVFGTLVYANALAGAVVLLLPVAVVLAFNGTRRFRGPIRGLVIGLTLFLGLGGLFWTGSKSGWLIALGLGGIWLIRLRWSVQARRTILMTLIAAGSIAFGVRFHAYFAAGATSLGARFDYWRAAARITLSEPVFGSGPGTFQRPYARLKSPAAEMARLAHNDYLEQFSDSGFVGGISYLGWVVLLILLLARRVWGTENPLYFAWFLGLSGWFVQSISEFSLYVPALAWTAFAMSGTLLNLTMNQFDNADVHR